MPFGESFSHENEVGFWIDKDGKIAIFDKNFEFNQKNFYSLSQNPTSLGSFGQ